MPRQSTSPQPPQPTRRERLHAEQLRRLCDQTNPAIVHIRHCPTCQAMQPCPTLAKKEQ